jgi:GT2 family glycosyltransferase
MNNNHPTSSLIISVYKDTEALNLILDCIDKQTVKPNEIIISEDGESPEMASYILQANITFSHLNIIHLHQEDLGWRKNRALNRAVIASKYEYLIFIDGDCLPYCTFIENHLLLSHKKIILAGRRIEFNEQLSAQIRCKAIDVIDLTNHYLKNLPTLLKFKTRHLEEMFYINAKNLLSKIFRKDVNFLLGCNWSCYKEDLLKINGFDENFTAPTYGEDTDVAMRFKGIGIELKSCRYNANLVHLYHKKNFNQEQAHTNYLIHNQSVADKQYVCLNGIKKLS